MLDKDGLTINVRLCDWDEEPEQRLAEVTIRFSSGPLAGLQLGGFSVWNEGRRRSPRVIFPGTTRGAERRVLLEPMGDVRPARVLRSRILVAYAEAVAREKLEGRE